VPGNELRVVNIAETDTEACCGTHCDNTAEVGLIKLIKSARISDGIVRLYYVAGEHALSLLHHDSDILNGLTSSWGIASDDILPTANRFFDGYKKYAALVQKQNTQIIDLQMKAFLLDPDSKLGCFDSTENNATLYVGNMAPFASKLKSLNKGAVFVGASFIYGLLGSPALVPKLSELEAALHRIEVESAEEERAKKAKREGPKAASSSASEQKQKEAADSAPAAAAPAAASSSSKPKQLVRVKDTVTVTTKDKGKKVTEKISGLAEFVVFQYEGHQSKVMQWFKDNGFTVAEE